MAIATGALRASTDRHHISRARPHTRPRSFFQGATSAAESTVRRARPENSISLPMTDASAVPTDTAITVRQGGGTRPITRKPSNPTAKRAGNGGLTPKVRRAIDAMINEGLSRQEAAKAAGLCDNAMYQAFRKPAVLTYWNDGLQVLRTGTRARNIQRLTEIRDQDKNLNAAVSAVKVLEEAADHRQQAAAGRTAMPGIIVQINTGNRGRDIGHDTLIEVNQLTDNGDVQDG